MSVSVQNEPVSSKLDSKILVIGVGGAGCNSLNRMYAMGFDSAELVAINTDKQHLSTIDDNIAKILIGKAVTQGFGAGGHVEVGAKSLEYSRKVVEELCSNAQLVFTIAGMGGGTGTGAAPLIAEIARKAGALSIGIVTYPFDLERLKQAKAEDGIVAVSNVADSTIVIDNNRLLELVPNLPVNEAFKVADELICRTVRGISETLTKPSLINLDFADVKAVTANKGMSTIAVGESEASSNRAQEVVKDALSSALLDVDVFGAKGALIHI
ncbi:MAG: cell division protein FtsZ, partial [Candidatus Diapherotrites archaeon]